MRHYHDDKRQALADEMAGKPCSTCSRNPRGTDADTRCDACKKGELERWRGDSPRLIEHQAQQPVPVADGQASLFGGAA